MCVWFARNIEFLIEIFIVSKVHAEKVKMRKLLVIFGLVCLGSFAATDVLNLPRNFKIGCSTAAYQIEGAWNLSGKGPNIWDDFTQRFPHLIIDESNGEVAANSYEFVDDDVDALRTVGVSC